MYIYECQRITLQNAKKIAAVSSKHSQQRDTHAHIQTSSFVIISRYK